MLVTNFIKTYGIKKLIEKYPIEIKEYEDRIILNYNDIKLLEKNISRFDDLLSECRSLILRKKDYKILSRSFDRFFNLNENPKDKYFNLEKCLFQEKLDGSLINIYYDDKSWCVATRKMAFAEGPICDLCKDSYATRIKKLIVNENIENIENEFQKKLNQNLAKDYTYIFEFISPLNRIITPYEKENLVLLDIRNKFTGEYLNFSLCKLVAKKLGLNIVNLYNLKEEIFKFLEKQDKLFEGLVAIDFSNNHKRIKIKNKSYLEFHRKRCLKKLGHKVLVDLVIENEEQEWLNYFPKDMIFLGQYIRFKLKLITQLNIIWQTNNGLDTKSFAEKVNKYPFKSLLFDKRKNPEKTFSEIFLTKNRNFFYKLFPKNLHNLIK